MGIDAVVDTSPFVGWRSESNKDINLERRPRSVLIACRAKPSAWSNFRYESNQEHNFLIFYHINKASTAAFDSILPSHLQVEKVS